MMLGNFQKGAIIAILLVNIFSCVSNQSKDNPINTANDVLLSGFKDSLILINPIFKWHRDIDTVLLGDMNGDEVMDTAIITSPYRAYDNPNNSASNYGCADLLCETIVQFSFDTANIEFSNTLGFASFFAMDDLDDNGIKEVGFVTQWFQGCWQTLYAYGINNGVWQSLVDGRVYACEEQDFSKRINKIGNKKVEFTHAVWNEAAGMETDTTIIYSLN